MIARARPTLHPIEAHLRALRTSSELTQWFRRMKEPAMEQVTPEGVIAALNKVNIIPVLMGMHGLAGYRSEARATQDVDVLVSKKDARKAVRVLEAEYPFLEVHEGASVVRLVNPSTLKTIIDIMRSSSELTRLVFRHTVRIGKTHRIPRLEMGLVCKLASMTAPNRREAKRMIDLGDFIDMVEHNRGAIDLGKLKSLAEQVQSGGGTKILRMVEDVDAGRRITL